ncbi:MAG: Ku protein [Acidimicrobiales bacterium]
MPRAIWTGTISFGLVNVPVRMYAAVSRKNVRFNQLDARSGSRIRLKKVSAADGSDVPNDALVRGYEVSPDNYVLVTDDELAAMDPDASRTIDLAEFVDLDQIDPIHFDGTYYLAPDPQLAKSYALLVEAMSQTNRAGIARFVMRGRQHLAAIRPVDGHLVLATLVYPDEIRDPAEIDDFEGLADIELPEQELKMAEQLVESLATDFDPANYSDTYREQVLDLIQRKAEGQDVLTEVASSPTQPVVDLMAALEKSVEEAKEARRAGAATTEERKRSA